MQWGHYFAAVPMFVALTAVVVSNALRSERATVTMRARTVDWRYAALALWMGVVLVAAGVYFAVTTWVTDSEPWDTWVFWVELLLLVPFTLYWILQTIEWWHDGSPGLDAGRSADQRGDERLELTRRIAVTPPCTGPGWITVLRGALRKPKRVPSGCSAAAPPRASPAHTPATKSSASRTIATSTRGSTARSRSSSTRHPTSRKSVAWQ